MSLRLSVEAPPEVPRGRPLPLRVLLTNPSDVEWSEELHAFTHGGFEAHAYWSVRRSDGSVVTNAAFVRYACPASAEHGRISARLTLAPGASVAFDLRAKDGIVDGDVDRIEKATEIAGRLTVRVHDLALGLVSEPLRLVVGGLSPRCG